MSEAKQERTRYEEIVRDGAWFVHDGLYSVDELSVPERFNEAEDQPDVTDEQFREDIREYLPKVESADPKTKTQERAVDQAASELDWGALWDEFDIGSPDAVGFRGASTTQLRLAIDCTDQGVNVAPANAIREGVESGAIVPVEVPSGDGNDVTRGYFFVGGGD